LPCVVPNPFSTAQHVGGGLREGDAVRDPGRAGARHAPAGRRRARRTGRGQGTRGAAPVEHRVHAGRRDRQAAGPLLPLREGCAPCVCVCEREREREREPRRCSRGTPGTCWAARPTSCRTPTSARRSRDGQHLEGGVDGGPADKAQSAFDLLLPSTRTDGGGGFGVHSAGRVGVVVRGAGHQLPGLHDEPGPVRPQGQVPLGVLPYPSQPPDQEGDMRLASLSLSLSLRTTETIASVLVAISQPNPRTAHSALTHQALPRTLHPTGKYSNGFCHWPIAPYTKSDGTWVPAQTNFTRCRPRFPPATGKVCDRYGGDFRVIDRSRVRFAAPADFPRQDGSLYSHAHVRRESWDLCIVQGPFALTPCQTSASF
jgi:hypothetical protein